MHMNVWVGLGVKCLVTVFSITSEQTMPPAHHQNLSQLKVEGGLGSVGAQKSLQQAVAPFTVGAQ